MEWLRPDRRAHRHPRRPANPYLLGMSGISGKGVVPGGH
jgi:hypothetical protein